MRPRHGDWGLALVVAIVLVAVPAAATTWIVPDPNEMADTADAVVLGTVERIRSVASFDGSSITTEVTLHVQEGYKGAVAGERIVLHEVGGTVGADTQWAFGSPEYRVGETVVAYVEKTTGGRLRTQHMAIGKMDTEILDDGRVVLSGVRKGGGRSRQLLSSFESKLSVRRRARGAVRLAGRLQPSAPQLAGIAQAQAEFRLMEPGSRWFDLPVSIWGDLAGEKSLGKAAADRIVEAGTEAWNGHAGSSFAAQYEGNKKAPGFVCNPGYITVSFDDPKEQVGDPSNCGGGALAVGGFCATAVNHGGTQYRRITSGAGVFNDGWNSCWFWNEANLAEILTHEIGHTIGFAHSWDAYLGSTNDSFVTDATMFWMAHFDGRGAGLKDYDRGALAYLYDDANSGPAPTPAPTPAPPAATPTPTPTPTPPPPPTPTPGNANDLDGDGVDNAKDNCPDLPNSLQNDFDADGVGDACDACDTSADPTALCTTLEGSARIVVNRKGRGNGTVRVTFAPWIVDLQQDMQIELVAGNQTLAVSIPGSAVRLNGSALKGKFSEDGVHLTMRKYGHGQTRMTWRIKDDALINVVADELMVRVSMPGYSASGQMSCLTRTPDRRQVTNCRVN